MEPGARLGPDGARRQAGGDLFGGGGKEGVSGTVLEREKYSALGPPLSDHCSVWSSWMLYEQTLTLGQPRKPLCRELQAGPIWVLAISACVLLPLLLCCSPPLLPPLNAS